MAKNSVDVNSDEEEEHAPKLSGRRKKAAKAKQAKPGSFGAPCLPVSAVTLREAALCQESDHSAH